MHPDALPFPSAAALPSTRSWAALCPYYLQLLGITSISIGILWDISWHETIGRDTFWTPAHIAIQLGGILCGAVSTWLIYQSTFVPSSPFAAASVRILGLRGPIGAWIALWGAAAMVISAPFDDWWHNTYGLDVEILSPPHTVLAAGMHHVVLGGVLLVLGYQNRATHPSDRLGRLAFLYASGLMLTIASIMAMEYSFPNQQRGVEFYVACGLLYPGILLAVARAAKAAWPATTIAALYMIGYLLLIWILPLFPAQPQLAPIYNRVDHMVPPPFPLWLIVPAVALDLVIQRVKRPTRWYTDWLLAPLLGAIFLGLLVLTQWYFSEFMLTPAADNWFFSGQGHWPYWTKPNEWRTRYWSDETEVLTWSRAFIPWLAASVTARLGLMGGNWMAKVKR